MNITIHRGQNQIGGSIIEVASATTKIILDAGAELTEEIPAAPQIEGLFCGQAAYDAVFISHYHGDHLGLCDQVLPEIPIYIGKKAAEVTNAARRYLNKPEYTFASYYEAETPVVVGDLRITPYLCDHSAFDAYMFHIACGDKSVLYSGDFRANGRKKFSSLLRRLPHADALIVEGTTLSRVAAAPKTEAELEQQAVEEIAQTEGPIFFYQAATNIDRLVTAFKAARRSGRMLLQDLYVAEVATAAGGNIPNPETFLGVGVFMADKGEERYKLLDGKYRAAKIGLGGIARKRFVMMVRPSMQGYLNALSEKMSFENGILFYSMWSGYKQQERTARFLEFMQEKGVRIVDLHTSGHADGATIQALIDQVAPRYILPVHTEYAQWFQSDGNGTVVLDKTCCI